MGNIFELANRFLTESPMVHGDITSDWDGEDIVKLVPISIDNLNNNWTKANTVGIAVTNTDASIYYRDFGNTITVIAVLPGEDSELMEMAGQLVVSKTKRIDPNLQKFGPNFVQVKGVMTNQKYKRAKVAFIMYAVLVNIGYTLISDSDQYQKAALLWKRIAAEQELLNLNVSVYDQKNQKFLTGPNGEEIYDGKNIDDTEIWSKFSTHRSVLLYLFKPKLA